MEDSSLCPVCGERVLESEKCCKKCGTLNYNNTEILARTISENSKLYEKAKKAETGRNTLRIIGIISIVISIIIDIVFAFSAISGANIEMLSFLPLGGVLFTAGLVILFVSK